MSRLRRWLALCVAAGLLGAGCAGPAVVVTRPGANAPWPCPPAPRRPVLVTMPDGGLDREGFAALALYVVDLERAHAICAESVRQVEGLQEHR